MENVQYKGIYGGIDDEKKYFCAKTGAHFEFRDLNQRLKTMVSKRRAWELTRMELSSFDNQDE